MDIPALALHDGTAIPQFGFGTFQVAPTDATRVVTDALEVGYRHIDTAQMYGNEAEVGAALKASGIAREELYVTTKLNNNNHAPLDVRRSFEESVAKLGLDRLDLFLIHWPLPTRYDGDFVSTWRAMAELLEGGQVSSIGVSNFQPAHLDQIVSETGVVPVVNQVEVHPFFDNAEVRAANQRHGVITEAWSPIAQGKVHQDATLTAIGQAHGKSPAQVALRWHVQRGDVVFPKSNNRDRMAQNIDIFDFDLNDAEMAQVTALSQGEAGRLGPNPDQFDYIPD